MQSSLLNVGVSYQEKEEVRLLLRQVSLVIIAVLLCRILNPSKMFCGSINFALFSVMWCFIGQMCLIPKCNILLLE